MAAPVPYCSLEYANTFLAAHRWIDSWTSATDTEKTAALVHSTQVISTFCKFYSEDGLDEVQYVPETTDDEEIPDWLRIACCYEALYFLDLQNDPSRPFPLGILGIIKDGSTTFSHDYEPPLFSRMARQFITANGGEVFDPYDGDNGFSRKQYLA